MVEGYQGGMITRTDESIYDKLRVKEFGYDRQMRTEAYAVECTERSQRLTEIQTHGKINVSGQEYYDRTCAENQVMIAKRQYR